MGHEVKNDRLYFHQDLEAHIIIPSPREIVKHDGHIITWNFYAKIPGNITLIVRFDNNWSYFPCEENTNIRIQKKRQRRRIRLACEINKKCLINPILGFPCSPRQSLHHRGSSRAVHRRSRSIHCRHWKHAEPSVGGQGEIFVFCPGLCTLKVFPKSSQSHDRLYQ